jgi:hypothetical protein
MFIEAHKETRARTMHRMFAKGHVATSLRPLEKTFKYMIEFMIGILVIKEKND